MKLKIIILDKPASPTTGKPAPVAGSSLLVDLPVTSPQTNTAGDARPEKTVNLLDDTPLEPYSSLYFLKACISSPNII